MQREKQPLVSVVIASYNGRDLLKPCLESVFGQTYKNYEVIIVDNGSTDGTVAFIKKYYPAVKLLFNDTNLGCTIGYNRGIEAAEGEYIATLNNDLRLEPDWMEKLIMVAQKDGTIGSCASKHLSFHRSEIIDSVGISLHRGMYAFGRGRGEYDRGQYEEQTEVFCACDAAAIFRKKMLDEIGLFDRDFFAYHDEVDLGWRIKLSGWKCIYVPGAVAYHVGGATAGAGSKFVHFYSERNRILTIVKNLPFSLFLRYLPFMLKYELDILSRVIIFFEWELITARFASFKLLPRMLQKRRFIQKTKRVSNKQIKKWIQNRKM